jgi:hypothetical protein
MSFRRTKNHHDIWLDYCKKNTEVLASIGLEPKTYRTEKVFREYLTHGTIENDKSNLMSVRELDDRKFWTLFKFVVNYFDGFSSFDEFETSRVSRRTD